MLAAMDDDNKKWQQRVRGLQCNRCATNKKGTIFMVPFLFLNMAEGQGFEPWVGYKPTPVFKTGALNHSATLPLRRKLYRGFSDRQYSMSKKMHIAKIFLPI